MHLRLELENLRKENPHYISQKNPREHQMDSFDKLSKLFTFKGSDHKAGILVLPTGAGKTFTAVRWICKNALPKGAKVLWLAHTGHLLDQAFESFQENLLEIPHSRNLINIRVVSSNREHAKASSVEATDDVLIMTTQTAISNLSSKALDGTGKRKETALEKFIKTKSERLFVVLDEAHHAPAFGCRNLLVGGSKIEEGILQLVPNCYFLGLTATPSYTDERRRGWLWEIFKDKIIHEARKEDLIKQNILAVPNFIQKETGRDIEVDDSLYDTLVRQHKDLPEHLIEKLANDSGRNDYIVEEYLSGDYGKTIIFADRWFQCTYIKEKLIQRAKARGKDIRVDAVFSMSSVGGSIEERNRRTQEENSRILKQFKEGKLDVLINVKMLTEGTDVPDVKTVFITRQSTSHILLTQMIGRALRGKNAGGKKDFANIVLFVDNWKRLIRFANPEDGDTEDRKPKIRGVRPLEYVSLSLIEELSQKLESGASFDTKPFLASLPVGWYETDVLVTVDENTDYFREYVIVYESTEAKFKKFIEYALNNLSAEWEDDALDEELADEESQAWAEQFFDEDYDRQALCSDLINIARHVAQTKSAPEFITFKERDSHDLGQIAKELLKYNEFDVQDKLNSIYNDSAYMWQSFYKTYVRFKNAFDAERNRIYHLQKFGSQPLSVKPITFVGTTAVRELTEAEKNQVFQRDSFTCQACGKKKEKGRKVKLQVDHINPFKFGGETTVSNSQTLCSVCNGLKSVNEINFKSYKTPLLAPKSSDILLKPTTSSAEYFGEVLRRNINMYYHCQAVSNIRWSCNSRSKHKSHWVVELYEGNNPEWLKPHVDDLVSFVNDVLEYGDLESIEVV